MADPKPVKLKPLANAPATTPSPFAYADAEAIQALAAGRADADQQRRAYRWILEGACGLPAWAYRESQRETDIALGRHFVGQQIIGVQKIDLAKLRQKDQNG